MISFSSIITTAGLRPAELGFGRSLRSMIWLSAPRMVADASVIGAAVGRTGWPLLIVRTSEPLGIIRDDDIGSRFTRPHRRGGALFPAAGAPWVRRSRRAGRPNGARVRPKMADQGPDAGGHCGLSVAPGTTRHPGRHLHLLPARRLLGRVGWWLGLHLSQFRHGRSGAIQL